MRPSTVRARLRSVLGTPFLYMLLTMVGGKVVCQASDFFAKAALAGGK